jgi:lipoprotein-anchoring transpeptidase ErfK/SrfK
MRILLLAVLICMGFVAQARAQQFITVDFSTGQLWHLYGEGQRDVYPIVLPKEGVQRVMNMSRPVHGVFEAADYKPTWRPTANMRRKNPALPRSVSYGQSGHPIGIYRLRISWLNPVDPHFWGPVRIHGGAKNADLHGAESAGCVRMLDEHIEHLVRTIESARSLGGENNQMVKVSFGYF